jgi:hypothetical protein
MLKTKFNPKRQMKVIIKLKPGFLRYHKINTARRTAYTSFRSGINFPSTKNVKGITRATRSELETLSSPLRIKDLLNKPGYLKRNTARNE